MVVHASIHDHTLREDSRPHETLIRKKEQHVFHSTCTENHTTAMQRGKKDTLTTYISALVTDTGDYSLENDLMFDYLLFGLLIHQEACNQAFPLCLGVKTVP